MAYTKICFFFLCLSICFAVAVAHGNLHEQIAGLSKQIEASPDSAALYLKRGNLYHQHGDFKRALSDFERVRERKADLIVVYFYLARLLSDFDRPLAALPHIQTFLEHEPGHLHALLTSATIHAQLGQYSGAVEGYRNAIRVAEEPKPEYYLELSANILRADSGNYQQAIDCLEAGKEALGFLVILQDEMIRIAIANERHEDALRFIDAIIEIIPRKEQWLAKKADLLFKIGNKQEAITIYKNALNAIAQLPKRHRETKRISLLKKSIQRKVNRLKPEEN